MAGTKTLVNHCDRPIVVTLLTRMGDDPHTASIRRVCVTIPAMQTMPDVQYGDDQNPYLNGMILLITDGSMITEETMSILDRGGPGTLDNKMNASSVFDIGFDTATNSFTFTSHN